MFAYRGALKLPVAAGLARPDQAEVAGSAADIADQYEVAIAKLLFAGIVQSPGAGAPLSLCRDPCVEGGQGFFE
jgi:hypothetical protein